VLRKDKALAEAAALLVLQKKVRAIWEESELVKKSISPGRSAKSGSWRRNRKRRRFRCAQRSMGQSWFLLGDCRRFWHLPLSMGGLLAFNAVGCGSFETTPWIQETGS
jgi:hypothetical protein